VKEFLSRAGVPFEAKNVEADLQAFRDLVALGFRSVPVTIVGDGPGTSVRGFDEAALRQALDLPST
jgi:hypothetical protein